MRRSGTGLPTEPTAVGADWRSHTGIAGDRPAGVFGRRDSLAFLLHHKNNDELSQQQQPAQVAVTACRPFHLPQQQDGQHGIATHFQAEESLAAASDRLDVLDSAVDQLAAKVD